MWECACDWGWNGRGLGIYMGLAQSKGIGMGMCMNEYNVKKILINIYRHNWKTNNCWAVFDFENYLSVLNTWDVVGIVYNYHSFLQLFSLSSTGTSQNNCLIYCFQKTLHNVLNKLNLLFAKKNPVKLIIFINNRITLSLLS